jgi:hypothetical protein
MMGSTRRHVLAALLAAATATALMGPAGAGVLRRNLIRDGEFGFGIPHDGATRTFPAGSDMGAWHVSVAAVGVARPVPGIATGISGPKQHFLSLKDPEPGTESPPVGRVCQRVDLDPAASYEVSFYSAALIYDDVLIVVWNNAAVGQFAESGSFGTTDWQLRTIDLGSGNGSTGKLCFTGSGDGYPVVDAVKLVATS